MSEHILRKEDELTKKRLSELSGLSYNREIPVYSDFLNMYEQSLFNSLKFPNYEYSLYGGYDFAERRIACFREAAIDFSYPIVCIKITPVSLKFSEKLTHRDFLGSVLGLGIDRSKVGDIIVKSNYAYIFVIDTMAQYIIDNITRVRNTPVFAVYYDGDIVDCTPDYKEISGSVASVRLDSVLALAFGESRSKIISYIENAEVFVNGRLTTNNSYNLKEEDIVSVRHVGRFRFKGTSNTTKKGRLFVKLDKYI